MNVTKQTDKINVFLSIYVKAAKELGIETEIIDPLRIIRFYKDGKSWFIYKAILPLNNFPSTTISDSKSLTATALKQNNLPYSKHRIFTEFEDAKVYFQENMGKRMVVKPDRGIGGAGVSLTTSSIEDLEKSFAKARQYSKYVLIEEFFTGNNYRILTLGDRVIAAALRKPATVIGDGEHTIGELVELENSKREIKSSSMIDLDEEVEKHLSNNGKSYAYVPAKDEEVSMRASTNISTGGYTIDVTSSMHPETVKVMTACLKALNMNFAGIDLITEDISKPINHENAVINEVNFNPGLRIHEYARGKMTGSVAVEILKYMLENYESPDFI